MAYKPGDIASKAGETAFGVARRTRRKVFEEATSSGATIPSRPRRSTPTTHSRRGRPSGPPL